MSRGRHRELEGTRASSQPSKLRAGVEPTRLLTVNLTGFVFCHTAKMVLDSYVQRCARGRWLRNPRFVALWWSRARGDTILNVCLVVSADVTFNMAQLQDPRDMKTDAAWNCLTMPLGWIQRGCDEMVRRWVCVALVISLSYLLPDSKPQHIMPLVLMTGAGMAPCTNGLESLVCLGSTALLSTVDTRGSTSSSS